MHEKKIMELLRQERPPVKLCGIYRDAGGALHNGPYCQWVFKPVLAYLECTIEDFVCGQLCLRCMPQYYATLSYTVSGATLEPACSAQLAKEGMMRRCLELEREVARLGMAVERLSGGSLSASGVLQSGLCCQVEEEEKEGQQKKRKLEQAARDVPL